MQSWCVLCGDVVLIRFGLQEYDVWVAGNSY